MSTATEAIIPTYMKRFECIGAECEDSCCQFWSVHLDKTTYKKYSKLGLTKHIKRLKPNSELVYAAIKMNQEGECPFLDQGLCGIQKKYGENYLSTTCSVYPRRWNLVDQRIEVSGALSCPELVRKVLLEPSGITLEQTDVQTVAPPFFTHAIFSSNTTDPKKLHLHDVRHFMLSLLQYRKYTIQERLWILGMFIAEYEQLDHSNSKLESLLSKYVINIESMSYKGLMDQFPHKEAFLLSWFSNFQKLAFENYHNKRFVECNTLFQEGLVQLNSDENSIVSRYIGLRETYFDPFIREHEYIFENFAVHFVYSNIMPYNVAISPFSQYMELIINMTLINVYLIGISGNSKGLNPEMVVKVVQTLSKRMAHSADLIPTCIQSLNELEVNSMSAATICIKL